MAQKQNILLNVSNMPHNIVYPNMPHNIVYPNMPHNSVYPNIYSN